MGGIVVAEVLLTLELSTEQLEALLLRTIEGIIVVLESNGVNFTLRGTLEVEFENGIFGNGVIAAEIEFFPAISGQGEFVFI